MHISHLIIHLERHRMKPLISAELQKKTNLIDIGMLTIISIALVLKFQLIFQLKIGWDEFHYLSQVHSYLQKQLHSIFQCFHVHLFSWLPIVSQNEVAQVIAARSILFVLFLGSCVLIYLIGKQILNRSGSIFAVLCYVSLSNIIFHGVSFRGDSICSFLFLFSVYQIAIKPMSGFSMILSGSAMALSLMVSIKTQFHLLVIGFIFISLLMTSKNKKRTGIYIAIFLLSFFSTFIVLYIAHLSSLSEVSSTGALGVVASAGEKTIILKSLFPRLAYFKISILKNPIVWFFFFFGVAVAFWDGLRHGKWFASPRVTFIAYSFLILPCTLLIYRNAFPYYYVFIMAPAIIFCGVIMHQIMESHQKNGYVSLLIIAAIFPVMVFINFVDHYSKASSDQIAGQKEIIETVHEMFPEPVYYIDGCSAISSFPKVGLFMSTWGMETYLQAQKPIMREILKNKKPPFMLINIPSLDFSIPRENPFTSINHALLEEDWQTLNSNFIPHWGPVYVAGKEIQFQPKKLFQNFEILISGTYSIETKGKVNIDGSIFSADNTVSLKQGTHTIKQLTSADASVTLRWGKNLYRPLKEPEITPIFYGF